MEIKQKIESDFKTALKDKDQLAVSTLRMLKSALHNKEIEKKGEQLTPQEVVKVVSKQIKQREESIAQFKQGGRDELAEKESKEMELLKRYLPQQLSEKEVSQAVAKIIQQLGAKDRSELGKVMKAAMSELGGTADGKLVSSIVSAQLGS